MAEAQAPSPRIDLWALAGGKALLQEQGFRRLWLTRLLAQTGQNVLVYSLLVIVVGKTGSGIHTGLFVLAFVIPSATLGPLSGVLVDRVSRGWMLVLMNGLRVILCLGLVASDQSVWAIYGFALLLAASMQFVGPAESAALPQVVAKDELTEANSLFNVGSLVGQAIGMAVLAPLFLKTVGPDPLFLLTAGLFGAASIVIATVPGLSAPAPAKRRSLSDATAGVRAQFARAWVVLRKDGQAYMAVIMHVVGSASLLVGVTVLPRFADKVLNVSAENLIFVFSPAAIGLFVGLRSVGWLARAIGKGRTTALGFALLVFSLLCFGLVSNLGGFLADRNPLALFDPGPLDDRGGRILVTMGIAAVAGLAYSFLGVASRSVVNERIPVEMQGRVFAAQTVLSNLASIIPLLLAGALADWFGVRPVLITVAVVMSLFVLWTALRARVAPSPVGGAYG